MPETDKQRLATLILGEPVGDWIRERHRPGCSYSDIAGELALATGGQVRVSRQAIHQWLRATADKERTP